MNLLRKFKTTNNFFNASFVYILANGIGQGTTLLANVFFTRYMDQYDYGIYSSYYSYVAILVPFVGMNLYCGLANAYMDYKSDICELRSSLLLLSVLGLLVTSVVVTILYIMVGMTVPVICVVLALAHAYGFFLVNYFIQSMNMENRFIEKGLMVSVPNVLQAVFAGVAVVICNTYISRALGATIGILTCGLIAAIIILKSAPPTWNKEYSCYALKISLPAIVGSVSAMIMQQCDKVMITSQIGAEATAVYALVYNIGYILYAIQQATSGAWQAWLYDTMERKVYGNIPGVQKWYLYFMLMVATGLYMTAPEIVKILSPSNYWIFEYIVPFVIGSYLIIAYSMNMSVIGYRKRTDISSGVTALAAVMNVTLNYIFIPIYGGVGAAYTSVVSYLFIFAVSGIYLKFRRDYYFAGKYYVFSLAMISMMGAGFYFTKDVVTARYALFFAILVAECAYIYKKKNEITGLFGGRILE